MIQIIIFSSLNQLCRSHISKFISLDDNAISIIYGGHQSDARGAVITRWRLRVKTMRDEGLLAHRIMHASSTNSLKPPTAPRNWNLE